VLPQPNAYAMIRRRAAAGIATTLGNHRLRAIGITAYLEIGVTLEKARRRPIGQPDRHRYRTKKREQRLEVPLGSEAIAAAPKGAGGRGMAISGSE
jgi:hypothetical protein